MYHSIVLMEGICANPEDKGEDDKCLEEVDKCCTGKELILKKVKHSIGFKKN